MPNTNSAKKRLRQNKKRRIHNKAIKSSLKTQLRKVHEAVDGDDADARDGAFQAAVIEPLPKTLFTAMPLRDSSRDSLQKSKQLKPAPNHRGRGHPR